MAPRDLRIDDLSDPQAIRLTHFTHAQLGDLFMYFGIATLLDPGEHLLRIATGHMVENTACCYRVHPEEAFLFTLIKIATGMTNQFIIDNYIGGDYASRSHAYPFIFVHGRAYSPCQARAFCVLHVPGEYCPALSDTESREPTRVR